MWPGGGGGAGAGAAGGAAGGGEGGELQLVITQVSGEGALLRLSGLYSTRSARQLEGLLAEMAPRLTTTSAPSARQLKPRQVVGLMRGRELRRAAILSVSPLKVRLIDEGTDCAADVSELRLMDSATDLINRVPPQVVDVFVSRVAHPQRAWEMNAMSCLRDFLVGREVVCHVEMRAGDQSFASVRYENEDLSDYLIKSNICMSVDARQQVYLLENNVPEEPQRTPTSKLNRTTSLPAPRPLNKPEDRSSRSPSTTDSTYNSRLLEVGSQHEVHISYAKDGPELFAIQLKNDEQMLISIMKQINSIPLKSVTETLTIGMVCLGKFSEDNAVCRAVVIGSTASKCKLFFVDFGMTELVSYYDIYYIPKELISPSVFALRFCLSGIQDLTITDEIKQNFFSLVSDKVLTLKVVPSEGPPIIQYCELYLNGHSIRDILKSNDLSSIKFEKIPLSTLKGNMNIVVSYVDSCTNFFVQLSSTYQELDVLMTQVQQHCISAPSLMFHEIKHGMVCCAYYSEDEKWYRAQVLNIKKDKITILYVDYGNEQEVTAELVKPITPTLMRLQTQAIHCALKGYEDQPFNANISSKLEEITEEKELAMNVCGVIGSEILLVELTDKTSSPSMSITQQLKQLELVKESTPPPKNADFSFSPESDSQQDSYNSDSYNNRKQSFRKEKPGHNSYESTGSNYENTGYKKRGVNDRFQQGDSRSNAPYNREREHQPKYDNEMRPKYENEHRPKYDNEHRPKYDNEQRPRYDNDQRPRYDNDNRRNKEGVRKGSQPSYKRKDNESTDIANNITPSELRPSKNKTQSKGLERKRNVSSGFVKQNQRNWDRDGSSSNSRGSGKRFDSNNTRERSSQDYSHRPRTYSTPKTLNDPASFDAKFADFDPGTTPHDVCISWFTNPNNFYVQIMSIMMDFQSMMQRIPAIYEGIQPSSENVTVGSCVIAQYPADNALFRAEIIESKSWSEYLVQFVDFGNKCVVNNNQIWPLDNELLQLPKLALKCSLSSISPAGVKWTTDFQEDRFFTSPSYQCSFLSKCVDSHSVSLLSSDGTSVEEALINENLAICGDSIMFPKYKGESVDLNLLIGQNLYSKICKIESMSKFYLYLDPLVESTDESTLNISHTSKPIECALHNFDPKLSQLIMDEPNFKTLENSYVIVFVDEICDNRLLVTLYEKSGFKLDIFSPDEGAYDSIPLICQHPVFSENFGPSFVTHVESINEIYLQRSKNSDIIYTLLDSIFDFYNEGGGTNLTSPEIDEICAAQARDGNWYRAKIIEVLSNECEVLFIDYGNKEKIQLSSMKMLDTRFLAPYEQAMLVSLGIIPLNDSIVDELKTLTNEQELQVKLSLGDIGWVADIVIDNVSVAQTLTKMKLCDDSTVCENSSEKEDAKNEMISVLVSHIDSPGQFYLHLSSDMDLIDDLDITLQKEAPTLENLVDCEIGKYCIAKYSADEQYYRAIILDSDSDIITVRFTDFGNTDVLNIEPGNLKCIPKHLSDIKSYSMKCSINASPTGMGEWTEQATTLFTQSIGKRENPIQAKIILRDVTTYVDLFVNDINITSKIVGAGFATTEKQSNGEMPTCFASHVNSPSEFWVQLENSVNDLELVSDQLTNADDFAPITEIEEEVICAAKFPEDNSWYRAKIIIHGSDGTEVLFMDYGNASLTNELRNLPENLKNMPALSRKCALQKPSNIKMWSKEAELKFAELAADGATIFHVSFIASGDLSIVELYLNNKPITEELVSLCEVHSAVVADKIPETSVDIMPSVHIVHCHGPDDFWVQHNTSTNQLNTVMNVLINAENFETLDDAKDGDSCISLFSEDNLWYRSKILDIGDCGTEVLHIDYGTTAIADTLKQVPKELMEIPPLAEHCTLPLQDNLDKFDKKDCERFAELSAKQSQQFYLEVLDSSTDPKKINLYIKQDGKFVNFIQNLQPEHCATEIKVEHEKMDLDDTISDRKIVSTEAIFESLTVSTSVDKISEDTETHAVIESEVSKAEINVSSDQIDISIQLSEENNELADSIEDSTKATTHEILTELSNEEKEPKCNTSTEYSNCEDLMKLNLSKDNVIDEPFSSTENNQISNKEHVLDESKEESEAPVGDVIKLEKENCQLPDVENEGKITEKFDSSKEIADSASEDIDSSRENSKESTDGLAISDIAKPRIISNNDDTSIDSNKQE
ncbi:tudor domain containing protein [Arctopsyche grandis]|uniref:tudor domain containing protein n=1 Tax=Arctopsyche grandis TaxID=121162 RepID=UPI00406D6375